jgi:hypothetical protein
MKILGPIIYVFAALGVTCLAFWLFMLYGSARFCQVNDIVVAASPNAQREAKIAIMKCNNKSPTVVLTVSEKSDPKWEQTTDMGVATTTDFDLNWLGDNTLRLIYPSTFGMTKRPPNLNGIEIQLVTKRSVSLAN